MLFTFRPPCCRFSIIIDKTAAIKQAGYADNLVIFTTADAA